MVFLLVTSLHALFIFVDPTAIKCDSRESACALHVVAVLLVAAVAAAAAAAVAAGVEASRECQNESPLSISFVQSALMDIENCLLPSLESTWAFPLFNSFPPVSLVAPVACDRVLQVEEGE